MPTEQELNAARVELQIANDNYATLANKYNMYQQVFKDYASASPEVQERAKGAMQAALESYNKLRDNMYAVEDRIIQAQNRINSLSEAQSATAAPTGGQRRRQVVVSEPVIIPQEVAETRARLPQNGIVQMGSSYTPSWVDNTTISNSSSRFSVPRTPAEREGTRDSRWSTYTPASSRLHIGAYTSDVTPVEIQRVRGLRGNDYLKGMQDLEKYRGYRVIGQNAYKNGYKWDLN